MSSADRRVLGPDIRTEPEYQEAEALFCQLRRPGEEKISDASEVHARSDGNHVVFAGVVATLLHGSLPTRICETDLSTGETEILSSGPGSDCFPRYSPDGTCIAFLSDRERPGDYQLYLFESASKAVRKASRIAGWIEHLQWSRDGARLLLGVAGHGADLSGGQGGATSATSPASKVEPWMPTVEVGKEPFRWRRLWIYDLQADQCCPVGPPELNIWEGRWFGDSKLAVIASASPDEGAWYSAAIFLIDLATGTQREVYRPPARRQLGCLAASTRGEHLAVIEALSSDRGFVAGDLRIFNRSLTDSILVPTDGVDITHAEWQSDRYLLLAGHRGFDTLIGHYDVDSDRCSWVWSDRNRTVGARYPVAAPLVGPGDCAVIGEGFAQAPELVVIRAGHYQVIRRFGLTDEPLQYSLKGVEALTWKSSDGLEIQGWLLVPKTKETPPCVMGVHGGPTWCARPSWLGRSLTYTLLLSHGFAIFLPNPRGSSGRGQEFAEAVLGDMGGADTHDLLTGLEYLKERQLIDPARVSVIGGSYGGFMAAWLPTQTSRFCAAVAISPISNWVTEHLLSNLPQWPALFLGDSIRNLEGKYYSRSPILWTHHSRTPTLVVCGALDRCTPHAEAEQLYGSLRAHSVPTALLTYPDEGHSGIRKAPAVFDYAARILQWVEEFSSTP